MRDPCKWQATFTFLQILMKACAQDCASLLLLALMNEPEDPTYIRSINSTANFSIQNVDEGCCSQLEIQFNNRTVVQYKYVDNEATYLHSRYTNSRIRFFPTCSYHDDEQVCNVTMEILHLTAKDDNLLVAVRCNFTVEAPVLKTTYCTQLSQPFVLTAVPSVCEYNCESTFACKSGYRPNYNPNTAKCSANGTWDRLVCVKDLDETSIAIIVSGGVSFLGLCGIVNYYAAHKRGKKKKKKYMMEYTEMTDIYDLNKDSTPRKSIEQLDDKSPQEQIEQQQDSFQETPMSKSDKRESVKEQEISPGQKPLPQQNKDSNLQKSTNEQNKPPQNRDSSLRKSANEQNKPPQNRDSNLRKSANEQNKPPQSRDSNLRKSANEQNKPPQNRDSNLRKSTDKQHKPPQKKSTK